MSEKNCGNKKHRRLHLFRQLFACFVSIIILILLIILIIWLVLRPTHPRFTLQDATVYQFNATGATVLTTVIQITLVSRNPNDRIGVYYDRIATYATYRNQQVTLATRLPPSYQGHHEIVVWSPFLRGDAVPVSPFVTMLVQQDQAAGYFVINIKSDGQVRWKVGTWISGHYHIHVNCAAYFRMDGRPADGAFVRLQFPVRCSVDV